MKTLIATGTLLASTFAASAHTTALPHVHGGDAVFFGVVLVLAAGLVAWLRAR